VGLSPVDAVQTCVKPTHAVIPNNSKTSVYCHPR